MITDDPWAAMNRLDHVEALGTTLKPGDRVRLRPSRRADIFDMELDGKLAVIEAIENSFDDEIYLAVVVDDDPGKDLGLDRMVGHRFFFRLSEVEAV
ncbi:MAG: hypothetical protein M3077_12400 [Candidatus Dormibacteraeota bacterium]|nr:hypothetical protein [Candidatus Dormibacteraeota bacterium]